MKEESDTIIRTPLPGDYGWIIQIHGQYYAKKFGWHEEFECIVAKIMVDFLNSIASQKQACYIAEKNGKPVGCIMLTENTQDEGKVRVMFVSESARGRGVGTLLMNALLNKAKKVGYKTLSLWTTNNQIVARELYKKIGFSMVCKNPNTTFAKGSYDEKWKMVI
jgi:N-acetylglutamate synthase-like GNAT family acetyltransferase